MVHNSELRIWPNTGMGQYRNTRLATEKETYEEVWKSSLASWASRGTPGGEAEPAIDYEENEEVYVTSYKRQIKQWPCCLLPKLRHKSISQIIFPGISL